MSPYRDRDDKPHLALGAYTRVWLITNIDKFTTAALTAACSWVYNRNTSENRRIQW